MDDALGQFLDNPKKYSQNPASPTSIPKSSNPWAASMSNNAENNQVTRAMDSKTVNARDSVKAPKDTQTHVDAAPTDHPPVYAPPLYAPPSNPPPAGHSIRRQHRPHTNPVIQAGEIRARDEVSSIHRSMAAKS